MGAQNNDSDSNGDENYEDDFDLLGNLSDEEYKAFLEWETKQHEEYAEFFDEISFESDKSAKGKEIEFRGRVISAFVRVEEFMNIFIADYFCDDPNKGRQFIHRVLGRDLDVSRKVAIIAFILNNAGIEGLYKKNKSLINLIKNLIEDRNSVAHRVMNYDLFDHLNDKKISFIAKTTAENKMKTISSTASEANVLEIEQDCKKVYLALNMIWDEIKKAKEEREKKKEQEKVRDQ